MQNFLCYYSLDGLINIARDYIGSVAPFFYGNDC